MNIENALPTQFFMEPVSFSSPNDEIEFGDDSADSQARKTRFINAIMSNNSSRSKDKSKAM